MIQNRRFDGSRFHNEFLTSTGIGIRRRLKSDITLGAGYRYRVRGRGSARVTEHRLISEVIDLRSFGRSIDVAIRLRSELRLFERRTRADEIRLRLRGRIRFSRSFGSNIVQPFLANEIFLTPARNHRPDKNRLAAGLYWTPRPTLRLKIAFTRENRQDLPRVNAIDTQITIRF